MRAYLDTNIWIYAFEHRSSLGTSARAVVHQLRQRGYDIVSSLFVLNELLVFPTRKADEFSVATYLKLFRSGSIELLPYTLNATRTYSRLRAFQGVKSLDALHLATAAEGGSDLFVTEDVKLLTLQVPGIGRIADLPGVFA